MAIKAEQRCQMVSSIRARSEVSGPAWVSKCKALHRFAHVDPAGVSQFSHLLWRNTDSAVDSASGG